MVVTADWYNWHPITAKVVSIVSTTGNYDREFNIEDRTGKGKPVAGRKTNKQ